MNLTFHTQLQFIIISVRLADKINRTCISCIASVQLMNIIELLNSFSVATTTKTLPTVEHKRSPDIRGKAKQSSMKCVSIQKLLLMSILKSIHRPRSSISKALMLKCQTLFHVYITRTITVCTVRN